MGGVNVELDPEPFMLGAIKPAKGLTGSNGIATLRTEEATPGVQMGFYRVRITSPSEALPAKYNTETTLGRLVGSGRRGRWEIKLDPVP